MSLRVNFSQRAEFNLEKIVKYLEGRFGSNVSFKFLNNLEKVVENISRFPSSYPTSEQQPGLRRCVINRKTILYYLVSGDEIEVVTLHDHRMEPKDFWGEL